MQAGVIDEMMEDMMDSAMDEPELEQETEEEVDKVSLAGLVYCTGLLSWCPWIWMLPWDVYCVVKTSFLEGSPCSQGDMSGSDCPVGPDGNSRGVPGAACWVCCASPESAAKCYCR